MVQIRRGPGHELREHAGDTHEGKHEDLRLIWIRSAINSFLFAGWILSGSNGLVDELPARKEQVMCTSFGLERGPVRSRYQE